MLKNKVAVITGGTRGIGFAIAEAFLKNGAKVAVLGSRKETVDKALEKLSGDVMGLYPDLTDYSAVEAAFAEIKAKFGKIDILVNNAGISAREPIESYDPDAFKGNVGDVSMFLRIAVTGKMNSPDMYAVMQILGEDRVRERISAMIAKL